ncbi:MAG: TetR/AcrR family transcriptional regulator [Lachnospiraceae bacterium]|nr:TetR/AcrR family transcriptional regulator [Lachnospiraceae bacterium]
MKRNSDQGTRELLIEAAKKEFLEKGYNKASLRTICANAGVTTGALYFFFENKADLFAAIVDPPLKELKAILIKHFSEDIEEIRKLSSLEEADTDHSEISDLIVGHIYNNYDAFSLILNASENTVYENVVDELVDMVDRSIPAMMSQIRGYTYDEYMSHWMAHISLDAFILVFRHERDAEKAKQRLRGILNYLVMGWIQLAMVKK